MLGEDKQVVGGGGKDKIVFFLCHSVAHIKTTNSLGSAQVAATKGTRRGLDQREEKRPIRHFLFLRESKVTRMHQVGASIGFALGGSIISTNLKVLVHAIEILG